METTRRFKNLGAMIDSSRNAVMTVPQLKLFMDRINKMGYNQLYLYIEDTYEVDNEPYFGHFRGRYSQAELREIDDYADSLGMELIPCIQTLAHYNQLMQWPKYQAICDINDCLLVDDERTYELIENTISSLSKCLRTKKFHIGMDEPFNFCKGKYRDIHGEFDGLEVFLRHLTRVCGITEKYGLQPMMWASTLFGLHTGKFAVMDNINLLTDIDEKLRNRLPKNLILVAYNYNYHRDDAPEKFTKMLKWYHEWTDKSNLIYAGGAWKWASLSPRNEISFINTRYAMDACEECGVDTFFTTLWGDNGAEASPYSVLPAIAYTACLNLGITEMDEVKAKFLEWTGVEWDDYMLIDQLDNTPEFMIGYAVNQSKYQLYNDCFLGKLDSIVAPYDTKNYAKYAKQLADAVPRAGEYKYILDFYAKLASVLSLKADIGIRTRDVYKNGDKAKLDALIKDYAEIIVRTEALYEAFRVQWFTENKLNGFETQDIRLGGLIMRIKNCKRILEDYRDGKIDSIPALEEETLPYPYPNKPCPMSGVEVEGWVPKLPIASWKEAVSTNII